MSVPALYAGPIVDAHHHLWRYDPAAYPWLAGVGLEPLRRDIAPADYAAAAKTLSIVQTVWIEALASDPLGEAVTAQRWSTGAPGLCAAIVAHAPLDAPDLAARLDALATHVPNLRGIRDIVAARPGGPGLSRRPDLLGVPAFAGGLRLLAERGLAFDLMLEAPQLAEAARLLGGIPDLRVIIEHAGSPDLSSGPSRLAWMEGLRAMAALPNVAIKISALHCRMPGWSDAALQEAILAIVALFGADRVAFGSDFPVHDRTCPLARSFETFRSAVRTLSPEAQRKLFCDTARRLYQLDPPVKP